MPGLPHPQPQPSHQAGPSGPGCMRPRQPARAPIGDQETPATRPAATAPACRSASVAATTAAFAAALATFAASFSAARPPCFSSNTSPPSPLTPPGIGVPPEHRNGHARCRLLLFGSPLRDEARELLLVL
eukprot:scaffold3215_cov90-Isochrysis_galbana.AAC.3